MHKWNINNKETKMMPKWNTIILQTIHTDHKLSDQATIRIVTNQATFIGKDDVLSYQIPVFSFEEIWRYMDRVYPDKWAIIERGNTSVFQAL